MDEQRPQKELQVNLWLRVENNNKFVRGKKKARLRIEETVLYPYQMQKLTADGWEYTLTIPYTDDKNLEETIYEMLNEAENMADLYYCFTEADVTALDGSERRW